MKLRIKGNSLRFRVTPSEVKQLLGAGAVRESVRLTANPEGQLTYAVVSSQSGLTTTVSYQSGNITVSVPQSELERWAGGDEVGVYAEVALGGDQSLSVAIEKDYACLDRSDAENEDTFQNPNLAAVC